ncbi:hypothetical protein RN001_000630 [Aquatica leii]|uniref:NADP-dependent oxidoreductase domain-containing protein n=1 Tax=Aquatica leii TaxID=1421715 RepID=A0AAN7Q369_9COLE|nr:hypothetical protein RN001_000630 [Aquatica leii]
MVANIFVDLPGGLKMPALGYGTWQSTDKELEDAVELALQAGYRHIDTAYVYENEKVIGKVISRWISQGKLKREDLFLVTKLPGSGNRPEAVKKFLKRSLENLQVDYIDLYLIHVPFGFKDIEGDLHPVTPEGEIDIDVATNHVGIWKEMERNVESGWVKSIGVSNFNIKQIQRILNNARIRPVSLQIELHAYFQQKELVKFCKDNNIVVTCYSPLGAPGLGKFLEQFGQQIDMPDILGNTVVTDIAKKYNKTPAQVLLRHCLQKGLVAIPKSVTPKRIHENIDIFDFKLNDQDMEKLNGLDQGPAARILDFSAFKGIKKHPEYPF